MSEPIRVLIQTTIEPTADDWNVGRFSRLSSYLGGLRGADGNALFEVTARDRAAPQGQTDPVLGTLESSNFDELWLFAVDTGEGLNKAECAAISRFRRGGGAMMVTRDHMDLGSSVCTLGGVGDAHYFHSRNLDPDQTHHQRDDPDTLDIDWPNYHSGANGDFQDISVEGRPHPVLADPASPDGVLHHLPSHPHEGAVGAPKKDCTARVIATGVSRATGMRFPLAVAFSGEDANGRAIAQSTFHHFCDYNWDPRAGCPSFVTEKPGDAMIRDPEGLRQAQQYAQNVALWLCGRR